MLILNSEIKKHDLNLNNIENDFFKLGHEVEETFTYKNNDLVIGKIIKIQKHDNADTLNICMVDVGTQVLQIVCGAPNVCINGFVIVALVGCKLGDFCIKKSKIRGIESCGMMCSLEEIGFKKEVLTTNDLEGIVILDKEYKLGSNAMDTLMISDVVYDLGLTANRGDCLSYDGILRDLYAYNNKHYKVNDPLVKGDFVNEFIVKNSNESIVLTSQILSNIKIKNSSFDIKIFLAKHGIKSQNNVVDYANYIMLILGIPIHVYDADKIDGFLEVKMLDKDANFIGLDEVSYELKKGTQVICDAKKITSIACVLGSNETKVTNGTKNVLVEIGIFDPVLVRNSALSISKKTDASQRGEKGTDPMKVMYAYEMLSNYFDARYSEINFSNEIEFRQKIIKLDYYDVQKVLGIEIKYNTIKTILSNLNFELVNEEDEFLSYLIPSYRFDIFNDNDLIEEIIRVYGIDEIKTKNTISTFINSKNVVDNSRYVLNKKIEDILLESGVNQVITYSLTSKENLQIFNQNSKKGISLLMPMSLNRSHYRLSLCPSLIECAKYNFDHSLNSVNIFETGSIYFNEEDKVCQNELVSCLLSGIKTRNYDGSIILYDFFDLKGILDELFLNLNVDYELDKCDDIDQLNPYSSANIYVNKKKIGFIGLKHTQYVKKIKNDVFIFEVNLSLVENLNAKQIRYQKVNSNPDIQRDLTFTVKNDVNYDSVMCIFKNKKYLSNIDLINIYEGENVIDGHVSYTYSLKFSTKENNLTNEQVDKIISQITTNAIELGFIFKDA